MPRNNKPRVGYEVTSTRRTASHLVACAQVILSDACENIKHSLGPSATMGADIDSVSMPYHVRPVIAERTQTRTSWVLQPRRKPGRVWVTSQRTVVIGSWTVAHGHYRRA